jgi:hypothetical protein
MIEFMVISAPRCATTWAANWLTTDTTTCIHDPLFKYHYSELDEIKTDKTLGLSCTGLLMFPDFVKNHSARKVILHRPLKEINDSLESIGLPTITEEINESLYEISGMHYSWDDIFNKPKEIYEYLLQIPFDRERHSLLMEIEIQPKFSGLTINKEVTRRLINEMRSI